MAWTARDVGVLQQCVFEGGYDFEHAAELLMERLPKKRYAQLCNGQILDGKMCEKLWQEHCGEEFDEDTNDDERNEGQNDELRLELPLSDSELDILLGDISESATETSEMQWVLSYLEDPSNAVDESDVVFHIDCQTIMKQTNDGGLRSLDQVFEASRAKSQTNKSFDNIHEPTKLSLPGPTKELKEEVRFASPPPPPPCTVMGRVHNAREYSVSLVNPPSLTNSLPVPCPVAAAAVDTSDAFFNKQICHTKSTEKGSGDSLDPSSDSEDDWNNTRKSIKGKCTPSAKQQDAPFVSTSAISDYQETLEERNERLERERMKMWKKELESQNDELTQEIIHLAEKDRLRQEFTSLIKDAQNSIQIDSPLVSAREFSNRSK